MPSAHSSPPLSSNPTYPALPPRLSSTATVGTSLYGTRCDRSRRPNHDRRAGWKPDRRTRQTLTRVRGTILRRCAAKRYRNRCLLVKISQDLCDHETIVHQGRDHWQRSLSTSCVFFVLTGLLRTTVSQPFKGGLRSRRLNFNALYLRRIDVYASRHRYIFEDRLYCAD